MKMLHKYHGYFLGTRTADAWSLDALTNGWTQGVGVGYTDTFHSATYFDLAGMSMEDKTIFIEAATVQEAGFNLIAGAPAGSYYIVHDIMTSVPVDLTDNTVLDAIFQRGLGFPGAELNFEHVIYGRMQRWANDLDTAAGFPELREQKQYGSLQPTASDRIYSYRVLQVSLIGDVSLILAPVRHLIDATAKDEPTYEHIMRLKRSYDLQQSHDED